ncbi:hypothetical protein L1987_78766 [Smallanthus sonchifolius]|uniref:Uncharacterized protein n=1 Tax=Smallanthus sonchifolius TaxID=185202 RepID=A0ACB8ZDE9_9ASTR|nr:hypothetical protein L1987_78766 [Smallanthus sonchifolius]
MSNAIREYRKGNWSPEESLILITATMNGVSVVPAEENCGGSGSRIYCWSKGCLRSQNQCNDKWDNLLRDYKKTNPSCFTKLLSQTLEHYDENKEKCHRQLMELEQQRLQSEEARNEVNRQGIAALITSINKLSDAIQALISEKRT